MFAAMSVRFRKLVGAVALFVLVIAWALIAMAASQFPAIRDSTLLSILYYVIAGLGWVLPAMPLISWMSRPTIRQ
jgi:predicted tellurium resistance membrane protein TerC